MTTRRILILFLVVTVGFSAVFLLPKSAAQPFGIQLNLLPTIGAKGDWWGKDEAILQKEIDTLGKGTEFARKIYRNPLHAQLPNYTLLVSMVLSGHDMANSIHRPERCLDAQGWLRLASNTVQIDVPGKGRFPVTRLYNRKKARSADGVERSVDAYTYYWFVGEHSITATHWGRWRTDNLDRLFRGVNQRWAFITVTGHIPTSPSEEGKAHAQRLADETIRKFIAELAPTIHSEGVRYE